MPPLPTPKQNAIDLLAMGKSRKIFLQFDQCFWPREKFILAGLSACDNLTWVWENYYAIRGIPVVGTDVCKFSVNSALSLLLLLLLLLLSVFSIFIYLSLLEIRGSSG